MTVSHLTLNPARVRLAADARHSLVWHVLAVNSAVMLGACVALALGPATVSSPVHASELIALLVGVVVTIAWNVVLVRRAFSPLERLARLMHTVDPLSPGARLHVEDAPREVRNLSRAFNAMLDRLESERRVSAQRAVRAQEVERRRVARELHDELGQSLTGVLLQIDEAIRTPGGADLRDAREGARRSLDDVRRIARDLRPDTLEELGLTSALRALATRFTRQTGVPVARQLASDVRDVCEDAQLALYRVAQEALTNVARHAHARHVELTLTRDDASIVLTVQDDGRGIPRQLGAAARGVTGMRERALLVHGRVSIARAPSQGTRVRLEVPLT